MVTTRNLNQQEPRKSETYRRQNDVFGYELQCLLSGVLPVFQNLVPDKRTFLALGGLHQDTLQVLR